MRRSSESLDAPLPLRRWLGLRLHLLLCRHCRRYLLHIKFLRTAASRYAVQEVSHQHLPDDSKRRMKERLRDAANG